MGAQRAPNAKSGPSVSLTGSRLLLEGATMFSGSGEVGGPEVRCATGRAVGCGHQRRQQRRQR
eukprot:10378028-Karenia_brevis.AAC.1